MCLSSDQKFSILAKFFIFPSNFTIMSCQYTLGFSFIQLLDKTVYICQVRNKMGDLLFIDTILGHSNSYIYLYIPVDFEMQHFRKKLTYLKSLGCYCYDRESNTNIILSKIISLLTFMVSIETPSNISKPQ